MVDDEIKNIKEWGFTYISGPSLSAHNKNVYEITNPCCGRLQHIVFNNLRKQINSAKSKNGPSPCGYCGPKHRMQTALAGYIREHGKDYDVTKAEDYARLVRGVSEFVYKKNKALINPHNYKRGKTGDDVYHLDHIVPVIECFKRGWPVEKAGGLENLQMLPWWDNLSKGAKIEE